MSRKLIAEERQAVAALMKATDAFAKTADHLDIGLSEIEAKVIELIAALPKADALLAGEEKHVPRGALEPSKIWVAGLRHDLFQLKDQMRLLRKMQKTVGKNLKAIGGMIFDPEIDWDSIRPEIAKVQKLVNASLKEMGKLLDQTNALRARMKSMAKKTGTKAPI